MKRNSINFILTISIALILSQFLPWWSVMLASFLSALFVPLKRGLIFLIPFIAIAFLWALHAFWLGHTNDFILAKKIAILLPLKGNPYLLILVSGFLGGIAAGISAISGKQCSLLLKKL